MLVDQTTGSYPHLLITAGKSGTIYVINRDSLGHYNASNDNQIVQSLVSVLPNGTVESGISARRFSSTLCLLWRRQRRNQGVPIDERTAIHDADLAIGRDLRGSRASFAVSANTTSNEYCGLCRTTARAQTTMWVIRECFSHTTQTTCDRAYDSSQAGSRDTLDNAVKFAIPLVANGKYSLRARRSSRRSGCCRSDRQ